MPDKQKVTLYLSDDLHRQFKIRSAVDGESMSAMAQRALKFYLSHANLIENSVEGYGGAYQIHNCPQCEASVTLNRDGLSLVKHHNNHVQNELLDMEGISSLAKQDSSNRGSEVENHQDSRSPDEGELITC